MATPGPNGAKVPNRPWDIRYPIERVKCFPVASRLQFLENRWSTPTDLDLPPRSRNEALASSMRRMGFCEEQGSGVDRVLFAVEVHKLHAPEFRHEKDSVKVVLYAPRRFADMMPSERIRACYLHAALKWVKNATLCERFGINKKNAAQASSVIRLTLENDLIKYAVPEHPRTAYLPYWA